MSAFLTVEYSDGSMYLMYLIHFHRYNDDVYQEKVIVSDKRTQTLHSAGQYFIFTDIRYVVETRS